MHLNYNISILKNNVIKIALTTSGEEGKKKKKKDHSVICEKTAGGKDQSTKPKPRMIQVTASLLRTVTVQNRLSTVFHKSC